MSRPVDVLAVMHESERLLDAHYEPEASAREVEARAAVAELIEASSRVVSHGTRSARQIDADWDRVRSALARVRGAA